MCKLIFFIIFPTNSNNKKVLSKIKNSFKKLIHWATYGQKIEPPIPKIEIFIIDFVSMMVPTCSVKFSYVKSDLNTSKSW